MRKKKPEISAPQVKLHKASGRAYVCVGNERRVYFGKYGTAKAEQRFPRSECRSLTAGRDRGRLLSHHA